MEQEREQQEQDLENKTLKELTELYKKKRIFFFRGKENRSFNN